MNRIISAAFATALAFTLPSCSSSQVPNWGQIEKEANDILKGGTGTLSTAEVTNGLKEALKKGANVSASSASKVDGFLGNPKIKIPFPEDVKQVETKLRQMGLGSQVDKFIVSLNRGAEEAAKSAAPIFINAITSMTVNDAWGILKGPNNAATQYLNRTTTPQLYQSFNPVIIRALEKTSATKYYADLINTYNKIPGVQKLNPDLDDYATNKAIEGLFVLVAQEEANIRQNPAARTTDILRKVFDEKNQK